MTWKKRKHFLQTVQIRKELQKEGDRRRAQKALEPTFEPKVYRRPKGDRSQQYRVA